MCVSQSYFFGRIQCLCFSRESRNLAQQEGDLENYEKNDWADSEAKAYAESMLPPRSEVEEAVKERKAAKAAIQAHCISGCSFVKLLPIFVRSSMHLPQSSSVM